MQTAVIFEEMKARAKQLLADGTVARVVAWQTGDNCYDITPKFFESAEEIDSKMVFNCLCGANLSKYLISLSRLPGKSLAFLKPCDTYSFNQLVKEHRIIRENVMVIAIPCEGMTDAETLRAKGITGVLSIADKDDTLVVETFSHLSTSDGTVATKDTAVRTSHKQEQNDNPEPTTLTVHTISSGTNVRQRIVTFHK